MKEANILNNLKPNILSYGYQTTSKNNENIENALAKLEELKNNPDSFDSKDLFYYELGMVKIGLGFFTDKHDYFTEAVVDLTKVIELNPDSPSGYSSRAIAKVQLGDLADALEDYNIALKIAPKDLSSLLGRGLVKQTQGFLKEAIADFTSFIKLMPKNPEGYILRAKARIEINSKKSALKDIDKAISLSPNEQLFYRIRINTYLNLKMFDEALNDISKLIELEPENIENYIQRGTLFAEMDNEKEAMKNFKKALAIDNNNSLALFSRTMANIHFMHFISAGKDIERMKEINPNDPNPYICVGLMHFYNEDIERAAIMWKKAEELGAPAFLNNNIKNLFL